MYTIRAAERATAGEYYDAIADHGHANMIRRRVADICQELISAEGFVDRGDREWVYQTLAQAHLGMGRPEESEKLIPTIQKLSKGAFDMETFLDQNKKLIEAMEVFERTVQGPKGPGEGGGGVAVPATVRHATGGPISIDLGAHEDRPVKSIEVTAKIEFE